MIATPYQVKDPARAARRLAPLLDVPEAEILRAARRSILGLRLPRPQGGPADRRRGCASWSSTGIATVPSAGGSIRRASWRFQVIGTVGVDADGPDRARGGRRRPAGRRRRRARRWSWTGSATRSSATRSAGAQQGEDLRLTIDAGIQARTEEVLADLSARPTSRRARRRSSWTRATPRCWRWPTGPRVDPSDPASADLKRCANMATGFTYEPGSTFKAFTVAGALSEGLVTPSTAFYLPIEIQVADRTISDAEDRGAETLTVAQILAQSSNVGRGEDRASSSARSASTAGCGGSASATRPGSTSPARSRASSRTAATEYLGLDDGQPADRPGPLGDADADGRRLRGDRRTAASCARRG